MRARNRVAIGLSYRRRGGPCNAFHTYYFPKCFQRLIYDRLEHIRNSRFRYCVNYKLDLGCCDVDDRLTLYDSCTVHCSQGLLSMQEEAKITLVRQINWPNQTRQINICRLPEANIGIWEKPLITPLFWANHQRKTNNWLKTISHILRFQQMLQK